MNGPEKPFRFLFKYGQHIGYGAIGAFFCMIKYQSRGTMCPSDARIDGKVVIVTGANTGLGKETAAELARRGGKIYLACRSEERGLSAVQDILQTNPDLRQDNLIFVKLDLASIKSIREFARIMKEKEEKVDILINNAAVMTPPRGAKTRDCFDATVGINHLGPFLLSNLLMDQLIAASPSRIITVSSRVHWGAMYCNLNRGVLPGRWRGKTAYIKSKLANVIFSRELGLRLRGTGVTTYSLHPGIIFGTTLYKNTPLLGWRILGGPSLLSIVMWPFSTSVRRGTQTQIYCAVDESLTHETGNYYHNCKLSEQNLTNDGMLGIKLWNSSKNILYMERNDFHKEVQRPSDD